MTGKPLLILAEGQSNVSNRPAYAWTPPPNLWIWDWYKTTPPVTDVGTMFLPASAYANVMCSAFAVAAAYAWEDITRPVYLVAIAMGAQPISQWLPGCAAPDMYSATKLNMEAAIASLGTDHELLHFWWQGESDAMVKSTSYVGDFQVHRARKLSEVWYPETTPMIVMGVSPYYSDDLTHFNRYLTEVVSLDPRLSFVETGKLVPVPNWENAGGIYLHMTGSGFEAAGKLAHASRTKSFYNPATGHGLKFPYLSTFRHMRGAASPAAGSVITGWNLLGGPNPANRFDPASGAFSPSEDGLYAIGFSIANCPAGGALAVSIYKGDAVNAPYSIPGTQSVANAAYASAVHSTVLYLKRGEYVQLHLDMGKISTDPNQVCFWGYLVG